VPITARLVSLDGDELLRFGPSEPIIINTFDLGYPDIRESSTAIPGRDGEYDMTAYHGGRAVQATMTIRHDDAISRNVWLDRLRGYLSPRYRAYLHVTQDGWADERRILVRGAQFTAVFDRPGHLPVQVGFKAPDGRFESTVLRSYALFPTTGPQGGISYPITYPISYGTGNVTGATLVSNGGTVDAYPYIDIYGFCTNPVVRNLTTGQEIGFAGLTIQAGDFLRVDLKEQRVLLTNDPGQSRYSLLDFTTLSWWGLPPGDSQVAFVPTNAGSTCRADLYLRDTMI
jgi:phage-related protein